MLKIMQTKNPIANKFLGFGPQRNRSIQYSFGPCKTANDINMTRHPILKKFAVLYGDTTITGMKKNERKMKRLSTQKH